MKSQTNNKKKIKNKVTLDGYNGSFDILLNHKLIGVIEGNLDCIRNIHIQEKCRDNGYGKKAVELYLKKAKQAGITHIQTTAVIHGGMEKILDDLEFTRSPNNPTHFHREI